MSDAIIAEDLEMLANKKVSITNSDIGRQITDEYYINLKSGKIKRLECCGGGILGHMANCKESKK